MARQPSPGNRVAGRLFSLALEVPPTAYVAVTGEAPTWARVWLVTWLSLWLLMTVVTAAQQQRT